MPPKIHQKIRGHPGNVVARELGTVFWASVFEDLEDLMVIASL